MLRAMVCGLLAVAATASDSANPVPGTMERSQLPTVPPVPPPVKMLFCMMWSTDQIKDLVTRKLCTKIPGWTNATMPECQANAEKIYDAVSNMLCHKKASEHADVSSPAPDDVEKIFCQMARNQAVEEMVTSEVCTIMQVPDCQAKAKKLWDMVVTMCPKVSVAAKAPLSWTWKDCGDATAKTKAKITDCKPGSAYWPWQTAPDVTCTGELSTDIAAADYGLNMTDPQKFDPVLWCTGDASKTHTCKDGDKTLTFHAMRFPMAAGKFSVNLDLGLDSQYINFPQRAFIDAYPANKPSGDGKFFCLSIDVTGRSDTKVASMTPVIVV